MIEILESINQLYKGIQNIYKIFHEIRKYKQLELVSDEHSMDLPLGTQEHFVSWIIQHTKPIMSSLKIVGFTQDLKKLVQVRFLLGEFPFKNKGVGVGQLRVLIEQIKKDMKDHIVEVPHMSRILYLPQEMEITLVYLKSLTSDTKKELLEFQKQHPRVSITELSLSERLQCFLLHHKQTPHTLVRLSNQEATKITPIPPLQLNELPSDSVEAQLVGAVKGDVIRSVIAIKTGIDLTQHWKIV